MTDGGMARDSETPIPPPRARGPKAAPRFPWPSCAGAQPWIGECQALPLSLVWTSRPSPPQQHGPALHPPFRCASIPQRRRVPRISPRTAALLHGSRAPFRNAPQNAHLVRANNQQAAEGRLRYLGHLRGATYPVVRLLFRHDEKRLLFFPPAVAQHPTLYWQPGFGLVFLAAPSPELKHCPG